MPSFCRCSVCREHSYRHSGPRFLQRPDRRSPNLTAQPVAPTGGLSVLRSRRTAVSILEELISAVIRYVHIALFIYAGTVGEVEVLILNGAKQFAFRIAVKCDVVLVEHIK